MSPARIAILAVVGVISAVTYSGCATAAINWRSNMQQITVIQGTNSTTATNQPRGGGDVDASLPGPLEKGAR